MQTHTDAEQDWRPLLIETDLIDDHVGQSMRITIRGLPHDAELSAGIAEQDGTWTLEPDDLLGLSVRFGRRPTQNVALVITATDGVAGGACLSRLVELPADDRTPCADAQPPADSAEFVRVQLATGLADVDASNSADVIVRGIPRSLRLSNGVRSHCGDVWRLSPEELDDISIIAPREYSGTFELRITTTSIDDTTPATETSIRVDIDTATHMPELVVDPIDGQAFDYVRLPIRTELDDAGATDAASIVVSGLPDGGTLMAGHFVGNGVWSLLQHEVDDTMLRIPFDLSGTIPLVVTATILNERAEPTIIARSMDVVLEALATVPLVTTSDTAGIAGLPIPLYIQPLCHDGETERRMMITVSGVPSGGKLSAGHPKGAGVWTICASEVNDLALLLPRTTQGRLCLQVAVHSTDGAAGACAGVSDDLGINVLAPTDAVRLATSHASGVEDVPIPLLIPYHTDIDPSNILRASVAGLPDGAILTDGANTAGSSGPQQLVDITRWDLDALAIILSSPSDPQIVLAVTITSVNCAARSIASTTSAVRVDMHANADTPSLATASCVGRQGHDLPIRIQSAVADDDQGERAVVTISGLPAGATLSAGTDSGGGTWVVPTNALAGLRFAPPVDWHGDVDLAVDLTAIESGSCHPSTASSVLHVRLMPDATAA